MSILNGKNLKTTALIDGDYMLYVSCHNKAGEDIKDFSQMKDNFESYLESILANSEANNYIGFLSGRNFRKEINPDYKKSVISSTLFKAPFAQPIVPKHYSKKIPPIITPLKNVYLANIQQVYPWDRGTNYAVELGKKNI